MATKVFVGDVYQTAVRDGKELYTDASQSIEPGLLVKQTSGSGVSLAAGTDIPVGVAYGARQQIYRPTSKVFGDGEELVILRGAFHCYYSADFFDTVPTAGAALYSYAGGLMDTAGTHVVGKCVRLMTRNEEVGGIGASQQLYEVEFNFHPIAS